MCVCVSESVCVCESTIHTHHVCHRVQFVCVCPARLSVCDTVSDLRTIKQHCTHMCESDVSQMCVSHVMSVVCVKAL